MDQPVSVAVRRVDLAQSPPFALGSATIDPAAHEALIGERREHIQPQAMKVLVALHQRGGEVVSRDELIERCWDGRIVGDDVINRCVSILRRLAGDIGGFAIETVPKAGYRLIEGNRNARAPRRWKAVAVAGGIAAAAVAGWFATRTDPAVQPPSIAMRPFASGTDQPSRDLAAASSEALSHMLLAGTFVPRLNWPATPDEPLVEDFILSGDVRQIGGGFNVVVQMRDRRTGTVVFSRHYRATRTNAAQLPEQIGAEMSSNIGGALAMLVLDRGRPDGPQVAAEYLKQIASIVQGQDPLDSYQVSRQLAAKYPDSALNQLALAMSTGFALGSLPRDQRPEAVRQARSAASRALQLDPGFGDSYYPWCMLHPQPRIGECEARMRAGMKADPDAPYLPKFLAGLLFSVGRHDEALSLARATLGDQPFQPHKLRQVMVILRTLGHDRDADEVSARARRWWPGHRAIEANRLYAYTLAGDVAGYWRAAQEPSAVFTPADRKAIAAIVDAWRAGSAGALRAACRDPALHGLSRLACIGALERVGDKDTAFAIAGSLAPPLVTGSAAGDERAWLDDPDAGIEPILSAPAMQWLRSDPRYLRLVERIGLLAYWRSGRLPDYCRGTPEPVCKHFARKA